MNGRGTVLALSCCAALFQATALAQDAWCDPDSPFGNAQPHEVLIVPPGGHYDMWADEDWHNVTVEPNGTLDTNGYRLRVCATLLNYGVITDTTTSGAGGLGGTHGPNNTLGKGHDPYEHYDCNHQPLCTDGADGAYGSAPSQPQPGQNGRGGRGGGGGGGGGGAWWTLHQWDADGGDGGLGGNGGKGGGYVRIYAYRFDNQGVVHANGLAGSPGGDAPQGCQCSPPEVCGPEHCYHEGIPDSDCSGGGGGGGGGGAGGNGGTVEICFCHKLTEGTCIAAGGASGKGGGGGGACYNTRGVILGGNRPGCTGGAPNGGDGGEGTHKANTWSGSGTYGDDGADGQYGDVIWHNCCECWIGETTVQHYELHLTIDPDAHYISGYNVMTAECVDAGVSCFSFRLDRQAFDPPTVALSHDPGGPFEPAEWSWDPDDPLVTAIVKLGRPHASGEVFYVKVDYEGHPRRVPGPLNGELGMYFDQHGPLAGPKTPIVFTTVEPWFAYLWWPVKDDGDNWNCDKATADLYFTLPAGMHAVSQGLLVGIQNHGDTDTYHWHTEYKTAAYLFSVAATNYHHHPLTYKGMPVDLYLWPEPEPALGLPPIVYLSEKIDKWSRVIDMLEMFENRYGDYPFINEKYAIYQWPEGNGAMEHQTASGQPGAWRTRIDGRTPFLSSEWQTSHELAHSWWGDEVTCATWHDIWLNEGFASYSEAVWIENQFYRQDEPPFKNYTNALDLLKSYQDLVHRWFAALDRSVYVEDASQPGSVLDYYLQYKKAPWVLHMMRHLTSPLYYAPGDPNHCHTPLFFQLLREYRGVQKLSGCTSTPEFQSVAESVLGAHGVWESWPTQYRNLDWFFTEWVYNAGAPAYAYRRLFPADPGHVRFRIEQLPVFGDPLFIMPIDIDVHSLGQGRSRHVVWNDAAVQDYDIYVGPGYHWSLSLDPDGWILKRLATPGIPSLRTTLGPVTAHDERAVAINSRAQVAATSGAAQASEHAYLWEALPEHGPGTAWTDLGAMGGSWSHAHGINESGQIVGKSSIDPLDPDSHRAFIWLPAPAFGWAGGMYPLPGDGLTSAHAINNLGQIVGYIGNHAAVWQYDHESAAWETVDLGVLGSYPRSVAWGINSASQVVGCSGDPADPDHVHAVLWDYDTESETWLPAIDMGLGCIYDINDSAVFVGIEQRIGGAYATMWLPGGERAHWTAQAVGAAGSVVLAISNAGQMVGTQDVGGEDRAFLWDIGHPGGTDLNTILPSWSCSSLHAGWDINDAGQIVGCATANNETYAFLLDIDGEPVCRGDLNCDHVIDFGDINLFVLALSNWQEWRDRYPDCPELNADIDGDGVYGGQYGFGDINPFVDLLASGGGQPIPCP